MPSAAMRAAFESQELVRAAILLGQQGNWQDQTRFVRSIAARADEPIEQALAVELGRRISRPDLALLVGADQRWLSTTGFLDKVAENLTKALAK